MRRIQITRRRFVRGSIRLAVISPLIHLKPLDALAQAAPRFGTAERRTLRAAADVIIPAQDQMPAASAVGAVRYVERVAGADQKLAAILLDGLRAIEAHAATTHSVRFDLVAADEQAEMLARFEKREFFAALRDLVYEAYYTQPRVQKLLGYNFRSGRRRTAPLEPFDEERVARVRQMASLYRQVKS
jgi:Gluconate 2-dehydrogenase subunit 3